MHWYEIGIQLPSLQVNCSSSQLKNTNIYLNICTGSNWGFTDIEQTYEHYPNILTFSLSAETHLFCQHWNSLPTAKDILITYIFSLHNKIYLLVLNIHHFPPTWNYIKLKVFKSPNLVGLTLFSTQWFIIFSHFL